MPQDSSYSWDKFKTYMRQNLNAGLQQNPLSGVNKAMQKCHLKDKVVKSQLVTEFYKICKGNFENTSNFWETIKLPWLFYYGTEINILAIYFLLEKLPSFHCFELCCSCQSWHTFCSLISVFVGPMMASLTRNSNGDLVEQSCIRDINLIIKNYMF